MRKILSLVFALLMLAVLIPAVDINATTTTFYSSTSDGHIGAMDALYATANAAATGSVSNTTNIAAVGQGWDGTNFNVVRSALYFDTSSIPDGALITSASIYIYGYAGNIGTHFDIVVTNGQPTYPHDPLAAGDYSRANYSGSGGSINTFAFVYGAYNTITLNATGRGWINLTGTTKLLLRSSRDISQTLPSNWEVVNYYSTEETGTAKDPYLSVTYTVPTSPIITANAATSVDNDSAQLNGTIDDDGGYPAGVEVSWGYGKVSQTAGNFASYTTVTAFAGTYSTDDTPFYAAAGLDAGSTYYYRFQAKNTTGTTTSAEMSFTTTDEPSITVKPASSVTKTTARLNGTIDDNGGLDVEIRWGYGVTSEAVFDDYDTITAWGGSYGAENVYADILSLASDTQYYFRFQARNDVGTVTSGEADFVTQSDLNEPTNLVIIPGSVSNDLTWTKDAGAAQTLIRYSLTDYPATTAEGFLVYLGTDSKYTHTLLTPGRTYYYSLWGESGGAYSASYTSGMITTNAGSTTSEGTPISEPMRWFSAPDYTNLENLPIIYPYVNAVADTIEMPRATFWMLLFLFAAGILGVISYVSARSALVGTLTGTAIITLGWAVQVVPMFLLVLDLIILFAMTRMKTELER